MIFFVVFLFFNFSWEYCNTDIIASVRIIGIQFAQSHHNTRVSVKIGSKPAQFTVSNDSDAIGTTWYTAGAAWVWTWAGVRDTDIGRAAFAVYIDGSDTASWTNSSVDLRPYKTAASHVKKEDGDEDTSDSRQSVATATAASAATATAITVELRSLAGALQATVHAEVTVACMLTVCAERVPAAAGNCSSELDTTACYAQPAGARMPCAASCPPHTRPGTGASVGVCVVAHTHTHTHTLVRRRLTDTPADICRTDWGGTLTSGGSYAFVGCAYTSANATGHLIISGVSSFTLSNSSFTNINNRIIFFNSSTPFSTLSFTGCFFGNVISGVGYGGCIRLMYTGSSSSAPTCTITSCTFQSCTCTEFGGALHIDTIIPVITDCRFYSCSAKLGGAVSLILPSSSSAVRIDRTDFASNSASEYGGSVYLEGSAAITFTSNRLCGGSAPGGSDVGFSGISTNADYSTSCSTSTGGCRVSRYISNGSPICITDTDFPLPTSCSKANGQNECSPCEARVPDSSAQTGVCGAGCYVYDGGCVETCPGGYSAAAETCELDEDGATNYDCISRHLSLFFFVLLFFFYVL